MNLKQIRALLGWCSVINFALLFLIGIIYLFFNNSLYSVFSYFMNISKPSFEMYWLEVLAVWKIGVWVFFIIPYFATVIVSNKETK
ncbi:MAG: hypothetical protein H6604_05530 [Flavobacteriales bacterium]|nr:hypothetical protein [Flavobacteriales bacterium]